MGYVTDSFHTFMDTGLNTLSTVPKKEFFKQARCSWLKEIEFQPKKAKL